MNKLKKRHEETWRAQREVKKKKRKRRKEKEEKKKKKKKKEEKKKEEKEKRRKEKRRKEKEEKEKEEKENLLGHCESNPHTQNAQPESEPWPPWPWLPCGSPAVCSMVCSVVCSVTPLWGGACARCESLISTQTYAPSSAAAAAAPCLPPPPPPPPPPPLKDKEDDESISRPTTSCPTTWGSGKGKWIRSRSVPQIPLEKQNKQHNNHTQKKIGFNVNVMALDSRPLDSRVVMRERCLYQ